MIIYVFEDDPFHLYVEETLNDIKNKDREAKSLQVKALSKAGRGHSDKETEVVNKKAGAICGIHRWVIKAVGEERGELESPILSALAKDAVLI